MRPALALDHVGLRVANLEAEIHRWRGLGVLVHAKGPDMAIVTLAEGARLALLGPGAADPNHLALRIADLSLFQAWCEREGARATHHGPGEKRFFTRGGIGLALEVVWRPS